jgi:hypothetical protein
MPTRGHAGLTSARPGKCEHKLIPSIAKLPIHLGVGEVQICLAPLVEEVVIEPTLPLTVPGEPSVKHGIDFGHACPGAFFTLLVLLSLVLQHLVAAVASAATAAHHDPLLLMPAE